MKRTLTLLWGLVPALLFGAQQTINVGTPDAGNGDTLRGAFVKVNDNFTEVYALAQVQFATTNVLYVDYANGDNTTGIRGDPRHPYKTLEYLKSNVLTGGEKIILSPGDHVWTHSGYNYTRSVSIQGAGMGVTRIVATNQSPAFGWVSGARTPFYFDGNYPAGAPRLKEPDAFIEIRDLTIDLTDVSNVLPATANGKAGLGGINANATTVVIENVEVLGYTSNDDNTTNYEAFGILGIGADVLISKCRAESAQNTYGSGITAGNYYLGGAFSLSGMSSCRVLDCFVDGNEVGSSNAQGSRGIGVVNGNNVIVSGNQVVDVLTGLVNDTGGYTNYVISGNVINSLRYGMGCNSPGGFKGLTVVGNVFDADHYGILAGQAATTSTDIVVQGNTFKNAGTNLWFVNLSGGRVSFNNADSGDNSVSGASGVSYHNNYNEDGSVFSLITPNPVQAVSGIDFGSSIVAKTGSGSPEGSLVAPQGSLFLRNDGGAGTTLYVKESGTGNTGWGAPGLDHTGNITIGGALTVANEVTVGGDVDLLNNDITNAQNISFYTGPMLISASGGPEGAVTAPVGSLYLREDGGAGSSLYVKESGTGNTGWTTPGGVDHTGDVAIGGSLTVTGDISNTGTLSVSNNITAYDTPAFGGAIISTTNRTLAAATVLNPAPVQLTLNGTEGALALVGGPEGNFADTIDFVETSEDGTTLTDKWTLAKRTYSSNSAMAYYYGPNADMGSNTNVYYMTTAGDTWNKRNASIGGNLTVATNVTAGGLYVNGVSKLYGIPANTNWVESQLANHGLQFNSNGETVAVIGGVKRSSIGSGLNFWNGGSIAWSANSLYDGTRDTYIYRDDAGTLALRNGTASNTFRVYGGYVDSSNFSRASLAHDGTSTTTLAGETSGTGNNDQSLKIKLAGNGALYVDGDTAGNARGANAVDLQVSRSAATHVASGSGAVAIGRSNTAAGNDSISMGFACSSSGVSAISAGYANSASGAYSTSIGISSSSSATASVALGHYANAYLVGQQAFASGRFSANGDAQGSRFVMRNTTTGSSADLFLDGSSARAVLPANTTWIFEVAISARSTDGGTGNEESAGYKYSGVIERDGLGNTALVGTVLEELVREDDVDWSVSITADDVNDSLNVNVTSDDANTVRWTAVVSLVETGG